MTTASIHVNTNNANVRHIRALPEGSIRVRPVKFVEINLLFSLSTFPHFPHFQQRSLLTREPILPNLILKARKVWSIRQPESKKLLLESQSMIFITFWLVPKTVHSTLDCIDSLIMNAACIWQGKVNEGTFGVVYKAVRQEDKVCSVDCQASSLPITSQKFVSTIA
jgi:hypothetical protein